MKVKNVIFVLNKNTITFFLGQIKYQPEAYSESCQTSMMERFAKNQLKGKKPLTISPNCNICKTNPFLDNNLLYFYALGYSITREYFHEQLYMESINFDAKLLLLPQ